MLFLLLTESYLLLTKDNDENVCHGEGDQVIVHSTVKAFALDYDDDDGEIPEQSGEEDHHVENGHEPQKVLKMEQSNQKIFLHINLNNR